jgi:hypothetical protein
MACDKLDLFRKYKQTGDIAIRNELVLLYMDSVKYTAHSLRNMYAKGYDVDDLVNEPRCESKARSLIISESRTGFRAGCANSGASWITPTGFCTTS